jgi:subtilisin family serine protease
MKKLTKLAIFSFLVAIVVVPTNFANAEVNVAAITQEHVQDEVIVGYFDNGSSAENASVRGNSYKAINAISNERISPRIANTEVLKISKGGISVEAAIARLKNQPGIKFVEPNYIVHSMATSDDPYFTNTSLWGMYGASTSPANQFGSNAASAWGNGYVGSSDVVVGIIDEGVQILHPDLTANRWINSGEIAGDGIDNDNNGYIDDVNGWDFVNNDASVYDGGTTGSLDSHGTHVSGTIGGSGGNSIGVAGVNWNVKIISTKFLGANGGSTSNAVRALDYLTSLKSRASNPVNLVASNNSWGGGGFSQALLDAINRSGDAGMLFVAAAGNSTTNNDATVSYPSNYVCTTSNRSSDCMIAVAAISSTGGIASFSSYGATTVDLGAPGVGIYSTLPNNTYGSYSGTSMATPHVTGAVALCKSIFPSITANQIRSAVLSSATATTSLSGKTATGGRLNVGAMATNCASLNNLVEQTNPIQIITPPTSGPAGTAISITTTPGTGSGSITFTTTGANCVISGSSINATAPTICGVTATKGADSVYRASTSAVVNFTFNAVSQPVLLTVSNVITTASKGNSGITLTASGGSGTGAITYSATPSSCVVRSNKLTVAKSVVGTVLCSVTATKAASGIYTSQTSEVKVFTFR